MADIRTALQKNRQGKDSVIFFAGVRIQPLITMGKSPQTPHLKTSMPVYCKVQN